MRRGKKALSAAEKEQLLAGLRRDVIARQTGYRERALKIFPHVCARCGREFEGKRLRELTVHHRDHNHDNNPPDGSNWELLCVYCHDHEHEKYKLGGLGDARGGDFNEPGPSVFKPFEALDDLLSRKKGPSA